MIKREKCDRNNQILLPLKKPDRDDFKVTSHPYPACVTHKCDVFHLRKT